MFGALWWEDRRPSHALAPTTMVASASDTPRSPAISTALPLAPPITSDLPPVEHASVRQPRQALDAGHLTVSELVIACIARVRREKQKRRQPLAQPSALRLVAPSRDGSHPKAALVPGSPVPRRQAVESPGQAPSAQRAALPPARRASSRRCPRVSVRRPSESPQDAPDEPSRASPPPPDGERRPPHHPIRIAPDRVPPASAGLGCSSTYTLAGVA